MAEKTEKHTAELRSGADHPAHGCGRGSEHAGGHSSSRRRFLKGAGIAAPAVIMTVSSKPVLARHCTVSGTLSGNLSDPDHDHFCAGRTPGYWANHGDDWPHPYTPGRCDSRHGGSGVCGAYVDGTPFHSGYANSDGQRGPFGGNLYGSATMMEVLQMSGVDDRYQLGAHAVAALLNALHFGDEIFGYNEDQIIEMWNVRHLVDPEGLKEDFELLNERDD